MIPPCVQLFWTHNVCARSPIFTHLYSQATGSSLHYIGNIAKQAPCVPFPFVSFLKRLALKPGQALTTLNLPTAIGHIHSSIYTYSQEIGPFHTCYGLASTTCSFFSKKMNFKVWVKLPSQRLLWEGENVWSLWRVRR